MKTHCLIYTLLFSFGYGLHVSYEISLKKTCVNDKYIFHTIIQISLDQCVMECVRRPGCLAINFRRRFSLCNLLNADEPSELEISSTDRDCVTVINRDMGYKLPTDCQECKIGQNCDENEKCTTTECPKLSLDNGLLLGNMNGIGNRVKFTCNSGYRTETGESYTTCEGTGNWSITPKCVQACPTTWLPFQDSCYMIGTNFVSLSSAIAECKQNGGHLAHINDAAENTFIKDHLPDEVTEFWIGLTEMNTTSASTTRLWQWFDDETQASFFDWASGEPNWVDEKCGVMNKPGWHDVECSRSFQPICEKVN